MYPVLFSIGGVTIYSFGVMAAVGFLFSVLWFLETGRNQGIDSRLILDLALGLFVIGLLGARALFVLLHLDWYGSHPLEIFQIQKGGLSLYGGIVLAILFGIYFTRLKKIPFWKTADLVAPLWILGLAFGRIGCFLNGCCYGKPTSSFFRVHPTQLYESWGLFLLFIGLRVANRPSPPAGRLFALSLAGYGILRFGVEFFRGDQTVFLWGLTLAQWMSLATVGLAASIWSFRGARHSGG